jgi:hypothetical protein
VILTHHLQHFLRLGEFGERAEPSQVAEQDGNTAPVASEQVLVSGCDHKLRDLRR